MRLILVSSPSLILFQRVVYPINSNPTLGLSSF